MTLPSESKKLTDDEVCSIENAVKDSGISAVHPEKMEAFADAMVSKLKLNPKPWRKGSPLAE